MSSYTGIYTGIVIDNGGTGSSCKPPNGKVLVHIDGITPTRYKNQHYKGLPASNVKGTLDVDTTKQMQVLAKVLMPIVNESSPGIYNANSNTNTPTRSEPANQYNTSHHPVLRGRSSDPVDNVVRKNNTHGHSFKSDYRSAGGLGIFTVPEPGTRVRIMFENGNLASPIVIGQVNTSDEYSTIFKAGDTYPELPAFFQNKRGEKSSDGDASKDESHAAKGGDTELPDKYKMTKEEEAILEKASVNPNAGYDYKNEVSAPAAFVTSVFNGDIFKQN